MSQPIFSYIKKRMGCRDFAITGVAYDLTQLSAFAKNKGHSFIEYLQIIFALNGAPTTF